MAKSFAKCFLVALLFISLIIPNCLTADAADTTTFTIEVKYGQTEARSMLDMINKFRTGSDAWYWNSSNTQKYYESNLAMLEYDYKLEEIAMQRAAEISILFEHTRPDGSSVSTLYEDTNYSAYGENIAYGYSSASSVFTAWQEADKDYSGQGHRRNMLSKYMSAVGIGHAVIDGVHYWVQEFGNKNSGMAKTSPIDGYKSVKITAKSSLVPSTTTTTKQTTTTTKPSTTKQTTTTNPSTTKLSITPTTKPNLSITATTENNSTTNTTVNNNTAGDITTTQESTSVSQANPPDSTAPTQSAEQADNTVPTHTDYAVWGGATEENSAVEDEIQTEEITEVAPGGTSDAVLYGGLVAAIAAAGICTFIFLRVRKKKDETN